MRLTLPVAPRLLPDYIDRMAILSLSHEDQAWLDETGKGEPKPRERRQSHRH